MSPLTRASAVLLSAGLLAVAAPTAASAHSLDSSTLSVHVAETDVDVRVSVALEAVDEALGTEYASADVSSYADELLAYLDARTTVTGADGSAWAETWSDPVVESVEGITSFSATVALDPAGADPSAFTLSYDAVIEAVDGHEAVVVLTDAAGEVSTAGVLDASTPSLGIGADSAATGLADMVGHGLHHVLAGADHLLFLVALLLVAPVVAVAGRWQPGAGLVPTARRVLQVITAFTLGHSVTLIASALGWVSLPSTPVEVVIALSVGVSAAHALRPLVPRGEVLIAAGFGLVHGLAFAGILADLGLAGTASVPQLLAFNVGVELAQLATVALVLPSLYLASRTRWYRALRVAGASLALTASAGWALDRLGLVANPLAGLEDAAVGHPFAVVVGLAVLAVAVRLLELLPALRPPLGTAQR